MPGTGVGSEAGTFNRRFLQFQKASIEWGGSIYPWSPRACWHRIHRRERRQRL